MKFILRNHAYLLVTICYIIYKQTVSSYSQELLMFLLEPVSHIVSFFTSSSFFYDNNNGFVFSSLDIVINKSCSGTNFWAISFVMLSFQFFRKDFFGGKFNSIAIPFTLVLSYLCTLIVNSSRIIISAFQQQSYHLLERLHFYTGIVIFSIALIIIYLCFEYCLTKIKRKIK